MSDDLHALVGAYVMDALDPAERDEFEAYLATSPSTAEEVASLSEVTALLASGAAETPPKGLRRAVMAEIDTTRQLPPAVTPIDAGRRDTSSAAIRPLAPRQQRGWSGRMGTRLLGIAAALGLVAAVGLGAALVNLADRLDSLEGTNAEVATLLAAPDAVRHEGGLPGGGVVTALISDEHGAAVAVAEGLPTLTSARMYALWAVVDGSPVPIGELVNGRPLTIRSVGLDALALTVEPRGDLTLPTGTPQLQLGA